MKLNRSQRAFVADKLMDSANLALAGLVFGQLVTDRIQPLLIVLGLALYFWGWSISVNLKEVKKKMQLLTPGR
jgi:hypothetical protein